jgi:enediyne biosynthesis protein E4
MVFTDVAKAMGLYRPGKATHELRYQAPGNRVGAWADFNNDGFPDVVIMQPLALFANRGNGTFIEVTQEAGIAAAPYAASAAWGDYDNDGYLDVYIPMQTKNRGILYHNNGDGTFTDVTAASGLINEAEAWAAVWGDYDNDGNLDLYIVNKLNRKEPNRLFRNAGNGTFTDVTAEAGVAAQVEGKGIDASFVDYNNDGFLDLFITNGSGIQTGPFVLLENTGNANHWIEIQLEGRKSNRDGIMTKVTMTTSLGAQYQEHHGPAHHLGQSDMPLHFGVGPATRIERIELLWPSGVRQRLEHLDVDQRIRIVEPAS